MSIYALLNVFVHLSCHFRVQLSRKHFPLVGFTKINTEETAWQLRYFFFRCSSSPWNVHGRFCHQTSARLFFTCHFTLMRYINVLLRPTASTLHDSSVIFHAKTRPTVGTSFRPKRAGGHFGVLKNFQKSWLVGKTTTDQKSTGHPMQDWDGVLVPRTQ